MSADDNILLRGKVTDLDVFVGPGRCDFGAILGGVMLMHGILHTPTQLSKAIPLQSRSLALVGCARRRGGLDSDHSGQSRKSAPCCPN